MKTDSKASAAARRARRWREDMGWWLTDHVGDEDMITLYRRLLLPDPSIPAARQCAALAAYLFGLKPAALDTEVRIGTTPGHLLTDASTRR